MNNDIMWADVVGYEGIYEVSDNGLVRTKEGKTTYSKRWNTERVWKQRMLKIRVDKENSCRVNLWKDGKEKSCLVHRLVAIAFIPKVEGKDFINHKDGSRLNNSIENLEWCNHTENNNHAFDNGLILTGIKITLVNIESGEEFAFRSMSKAGQFLGYNDKYISHIIKQGRTESKGYKIIIDKHNE